MWYVAMWIFHVKTDFFIVASQYYITISICYDFSFPAQEMFNCIYDLSNF